MSSTIKKWLTTTLAIVLMALFAEVSYGDTKPKPVKKKRVDAAWFSYNPSAGPQNSASSYTHNSGGGGCSGDASLCEIFIESPSQDPSMGLSQTDLNNLLQAENPGGTEFDEQTDRVHFKPEE